MIGLSLALSNVMNNTSFSREQQLIGALTTFRMRVTLHYFCKNIVC